MAEMFNYLLIIEILLMFSSAKAFLRGNIPERNIVGVVKVPEGGIMSEVQTMSYMTNLKSIGEIEDIRKILDADNHVEYWYLDINSPDNKLTIMGRDIDEVINKLKSKGLILQVD